MDAHRPVRSTRSSGIFPKWTNKFVKLLLLGIVLAVFGLVALASYVSRPQFIDVGYKPKQPVAFSHKRHAGDLGMDCRHCHVSVEKSAVASIPPTEVCMNCHTRVKADSPALLPVRESYATGQPILWVRVHRVADFAYFNHKAHVTAGVSCVSCHGRVDQMDEVRQVQPLSMAWCLECHRKPEAHVRPREFVTNLGWTPPRDSFELGRELVRANKINPPTHCAGCHR